MKYKYNQEKGYFCREDNLGRKLWVTMDEAQRIITLDKLGYSRGEIQNKVTFKSNKATGNSVNTVIDKYMDGDLIIEPVAVGDIDIEDDLTIEYRMQKLEKKVENLENIISELKSDCFMSAYAGESKSMDKGIVDRIRTWI